MPHGYGPSMCILIKCTKTPSAYLRERHLKTVAYADVSFRQGNNYELLVHSIQVTTDVLSSLGPTKFTLHLKKSILIRSQYATFYDTYSYKTNT